MAAYKKGIAIDMANGGRGIEQAEEVNLHDNTNSYETMQDAQDSENDDDDKVLINGDIKYRGATRVARSYSTMLFNALLMALCIIVIILSYFVFTLRRDLHEVQNTARLQAADATIFKNKYASLNKELGDRVSQITKQLQNMNATQKGTNSTRDALSRMAVKISKIQTDSASVMKTIGSLNSSVSRVTERASTYYPIFNAKFMGFGYPTNRSHYEEYHQYTLERCLENLHQKHLSDPAWNGLAYGHSQNDGWCICYKKSGRLNMHSKHYLYYVLDD